jgi:hypothetical protein
LKAKKKQDLNSLVTFVLKENTLLRSVIMHLHRMLKDAEAGASDEVGEVHVNKLTASLKRLEKFYTARFKTFPPLAILFVICIVGCSTTSSKRSAGDFNRVDFYLEQVAEAKTVEDARKLADKAKAQLVSAKEVCASNTEELDRVTKELNEANKNVDYWKGKQRKALKELWFWRGALIVVGLFAMKGPIFWVVRKFVGIPW